MVKNAALPILLERCVGHVERPFSMIPGSFGIVPSVVGGTVAIPGGGSPGGHASNRGGFGCPIMIGMNR